MKTTGRALREQLEELQASLTDARREVAQHHLHAAVEQQGLSAELAAVQAALDEETQAVAGAVRELRRHPRFSLAFGVRAIAHRFFSMRDKIDRIEDALPSPVVVEVPPETREPRRRDRLSQTRWDGRMISVYGAGEAERWKSAVDEIADDVRRGGGGP